MRIWAVHQAELLGDASAAMAQARGLVIGPKVGFGGPAAAETYCLGIAHMLAGDSREAVGLFERAVAIHQEGGGGPPVELLTLPSRLAVAYAEAGESQRAVETAARGVALARALETPIFLAQNLIFQARVLRKTQGPQARDAIKETLAEAQALVESTGIRGWQPFLHVERAELARLIGDEAMAEGELREARRLFTEMGAVGQVEKLESGLG